MKAVTIENFGGVEQLKLAEMPTPTAAADQVQIEVSHASVNPIDWKIREGLTKDLFPAKFPMILGWDAAGTISAVGSAVKGFKVGEKVFTYSRQPAINWGTYAEYVCVPAEHVARIPEGLTMAQAASIPLSGLTAWQALFDIGKLKSGESLLIHAGAGGVGGFAIQLAKWRGARVFTTTSASNADYVKGLGADVAIDYTAGAMAQEAKRASPGGFDLIFDCVGGEALKASWELVKSGGRLITIVNWNIDKERGKRSDITATFALVSPNGKQLEEIAQLVAKGTIRPPYIQELPISEVAKAQEMSRTGHTRGKIVLSIKRDARS